MSITVFNWEMFERNNTRYIVFGVLFAGLIALSIIYANYTGAIVLFILLWGYIFFKLWNQQNITISTTNQYVTIWQKNYSREDIQGFGLEIDDNQKAIKNIVFIIKWNKQIFTINDDIDKVRNFIIDAMNYTTIIDKISRTNFEKISRWLKI